MRRWRDDDRLDAIAILLRRAALASSSSTKGQGPERTARPAAG